MQGVTNGHAVSVSPEALVFWMILAIAIFALVSKLVRTPYPIVMLIGGALVGLIPGLAPVRLPPDIVFLVLLPILLFGGAWNTDVRAFRRYLTPILWYALGIVAATILVVAWLGHAWLGLPWPVAFVLGAIVSPSDAVTTEAIEDEVGFPPGSATILKGESLVNDAAALVVYGFAVTATVEGRFSLGPAALDFVYVSVAGIAIGVLVAIGLLWVDRTLRRLALSDERMGVLISLISPFLAYVPAEAAHASGVLATVAAGMFIVARSSRVFDAAQRIEVGAVWDATTFVLNGIAFILIGLQLPSIFARLSDRAPGALAAYGFGFAGSVIATRLLLGISGAVGRWAVLRAIGRAPADRPPWRESFLVAWSGMRGIVTLAGALALPLAAAGGGPFPDRDLVLYLAFATIVITLVGQGLTLPLLVRAIAPSRDPHGLRHEILHAHARLALVAAQHLEALEPKLESDVERARTRTTIDAMRKLAHHAERRAERESNGDAATTRDPGEPDFPVQREVGRAQRDELDRLWEAGDISDRAFRYLQHEIDLTELRFSLPE